LCYRLLLHLLRADDRLQTPAAPVRQLGLDRLILLHAQAGETEKRANRVNIHPRAVTLSQIPVVRHGTHDILQRLRQQLAVGSAIARKVAIGEKGQSGQRRDGRPVIGDCNGPRSRIRPLLDLAFGQPPQPTDDGPFCTRGIDTGNGRVGTLRVNPQPGHPHQQNRQDNHFHNPRLIKYPESESGKRDVGSL